MWKQPFCSQNVLRKASFTSNVPQMLTKLACVVIHIVLNYYCKRGIKYIFRILHWKRFDDYLKPKTLCQGCLNNLNELEFPLECFKEVTSRKWKCLCRVSLR